MHLSAIGVQQSAVSIRILDFVIPSSFGFLISSLAMPVPSIGHWDLVIGHCTRAPLRPVAPCCVLLRSVAFCCILLHSVAFCCTLLRLLRPVCHRRKSLSHFPPTTCNHHHPHHWRNLIACCGRIFLLRLLQQHPPEPQITKTPHTAQPSLFILPHSPFRLPLSSSNKKGTAAPTARSPPLEVVTHNLT